MKDQGYNEKGEKVVQENDEENFVENRDEENEDFEEITTLNSSVNKN